LSLSSSS